MKLSLVSLTISYGFLCIGFVKSIHGRRTEGGTDADGPYGNRLTSRQPSEASRSIAIVTDELKLDGVPAAYGLAEQVFPTHMFIVFSPLIQSLADGQTVIDGPLRIEIVAPTLDGQAKGLAVSVTDLTVSDGEDMGQPDWPYLHPLNERKVLTLAEKVTWRNSDIFDARLPSSEGNGHAPSLIESVWVTNALAFDRTGSFPPLTGGLPFTLAHFGTSWEFVMRLLSETMGDRFEAPNQDPAVMYDHLKGGHQWARTERRRNRGQPRQPPPRALSVDYLFYEAISPASNPTQRRQRIRRLYDIDKRTDGYHARLVEPRPNWLGGSPMLQSERRPNAASPDQQRPPVLELSRDPRLTSDVLPLDQRGDLRDNL